MSEWKAEVAQGLTPAEVSAGLAMRSILTTDLPDIAAWMLAGDTDTPALRELAGTAPSDTWAVAGLWRQAAHELDVENMTDETAARIDVRRILRQWVVGRRETLEVLAELDRMALYRFDGLDGTGGLLDEIEGGWGRTREVVLGDATDRLLSMKRMLDGERPDTP